MGDASAKPGLPPTRRTDQGSSGEKLRAIQDELLGEIDEAIDRLESVHADDALREHLDVLRATLRAHASAYLEHLAARHATLSPHTSVMYADAVGASGVLATTFRGLLEAGEFSVEQAARLTGLVNDHRTLLVFGDRRTGKSTLLNSLLEVVGVDERLVAIENGPGLPALRDRSFCVRLETSDDTDLPMLFERAQHMNPSRLVIGELHAAEVRGFLTTLAGSARIGGMGTLRAGTVEGALAVLRGGLGGDAQDARRLIGQVRPVLVHMRRDASDQPRLAALWSVEGLTRDELSLRELETPGLIDKGLLAEV
jgi:Flp pilus assembly CpaF family ATPase